MHSFKLNSKQLISWCYNSGFFPAHFTYQCQRSNKWRWPISAYHSHVGSSGYLLQGSRETGSKLGLVILFCRTIKFTCYRQHHAGKQRSVDLQRPHSYGSRALNRDIGPGLVKHTEWIEWFKHFIRKAQVDGSTTNAIWNVCVSFRLTERTNVQLG
jgi:hypothetical protein